MNERVLRETNRGLNRKKIDWRKKGGKKGEVTGRKKERKIGGNKESKKGEREKRFLKLQK